MDICMHVCMYVHKCVFIDMGNGILGLIFAGVIDVTRNQINTWKYLHTYIYTYLCK